MKISIVIPAYNEEKYLGACLENALKNKTSEVEEIIVVDNNSTDHTAQIAQQFPEVKLLKEEKPGTNNARQRGFGEARGELVAFIDADSHLTADWFYKTQKYFNEDPELVALSGPYTFYDLNSKIKKKTVELWSKSEEILNRTMGYMAQGGNLIIKKQALEKIGGFNTQLTFYGDDIEVAKRLAKLGKVKFTVDLAIPSSARRLNGEGIVLTGLKYLFNYIWVVIFHKPLHRTHTNVR